LIDKNKDYKLEKSKTIHILNQLNQELDELKVEKEFLEKFETIMRVEEKFKENFELDLKRKEKYSSRKQGYA